MVTYDEYLRNILVQIAQSHTALLELRDKPGDLDRISKELAGINGMIRVILSRVDPARITIADFGQLRTKMQLYIDDYSFEPEIERIGPLYSNDPSRIRNMRMKILEALEDRRMIHDIRDVIAGP